MKEIDPHFKTIGLAVAFSPTSAAICCEAKRLADMFQAQVLLIHIGKRNAEAEAKMKELMDVTGLTTASKVIWKSGNPEEMILQVCQDERIDLLVAGALKKETMLGYYTGTVARSIMRKAKCSVFIAYQPKEQPTPFSDIVVSADDSAHVDRTLAVACHMAQHQQANHLYVTRQIKLWGLKQANDQKTFYEYEATKYGDIKQEYAAAKKLLSQIPHHADLPILIKTLAGKSGFELRQFVEKRKAQLLVMSASDRPITLFDRLFLHDHEFIFSDLPCHLLIVNQRQS